MWPDLWHLAPLNTSVLALVAPLFLLPAPLHPERHPTWSLGPDGSSCTGLFTLSPPPPPLLFLLLLLHWFNLLELAVTAGLWLLLFTFPQDLPQMYTVELKLCSASPLCREQLGSL